MRTYRLTYSVFSVNGSYIDAADSLRDMVSSLTGLNASVTHSSAKTLNPVTGSVVVRFRASSHETARAIVKIALRHQQSRGIDTVRIASRVGNTWSPLAEQVAL